MDTFKTEGETEAGHDETGTGGKWKGWFLQEGDDER